MPVTFLLYPEQVATLWVFPLSLPLGWLMETFFETAGIRRLVTGAFLFVSRNGGMSLFQK